VYQYQRAQRLADRARQKPPSLHEQITAKPAPETMATAQRLKAALDSGEVSSRYPWETETGEGLQHFNPPGKNDFGNTFDTKIIKFADGSEWIRKRGVAKVDIDKSIAYARIAKVFGVETPEPVRRNTPEGIELWEPKINGMPAIQWSGGYDPDEVRQYQDDVSEGWGEEDDPPVLHPVNGHDPELLMNSEAGNRLGLVDTITNATDRHMGNWMVAGDRPVPIDSESADYGIFPFSDSPFALRLDMHTMLATLPPGQQQKWADDLEAQRPAFAALHHQDWLDNVIENYRALTKAAA
jgi:hypothetical protein